MKLKLKELKQMPIFMLQDLLEKEKNFDNKCLIVKAIRIIQNSDD